MRSPSPFGTSCRGLLAVLVAASLCASARGQAPADSPAPVVDPQAPLPGAAAVDRLTAPACPYPVDVPLPAAAATVRRAAPRAAEADRRLVRGTHGPSRSGHHHRRQHDAVLPGRHDRRPGAIVRVRRAQRLLPDRGRREARPLEGVLRPSPRRDPLRRVGQLSHRGAVAGERVPARPRQHGNRQRADRGDVHAVPVRETRCSSRGRSISSTRSSSRSPGRPAWRASRTRR